MSKINVGNVLGRQDDDIPPIVGRFLSLNGDIACVAVFILCRGSSRNVIVLASEDVPYNASQAVATPNRATYRIRKLGGQG